MKTKPYPINRTILLTSLLASAIAAQGQTINYNSGLGQPGDVLVCFRPVSGTYDTVIDAGPISAFTNLTAGQQINISPTYYTPNILSFTGTNSIAWSVLACARLGGANQNNLWLTRPRSNNNLPTTAWPENNYPVQGQAAGAIDAIGEDAANIASQVTTPFGVSPVQTTTGVVEHEGGSLNSGSAFNSYSFTIGFQGNFSSAFAGDAGGSSVEQTTATNFVSGNMNSIADFYQLLSTNTPGLKGTYLGYFTLSTNGVLVYTAGAAPRIVVPSTITSINSVGGTNFITFTTIPGDNYSLLVTNIAGIQSPVHTWPAAKTGIAGAVSSVTVTDVSADSARFYSISAY